MLFWGITILLSKSRFPCISAWAIHKLSGRFIWAIIHQMALSKHISATAHNSSSLLLSPTCSCFQKPWENSKGIGNYCTWAMWLICTTVSPLQHKFNVLMSSHLPSNAHEASWHMSMQASLGRAALGHAHTTCLAQHQRKGATQFNKTSFQLLTGFSIIFTYTSWNTVWLRHFKGQLATYSLCL